MTSAASWVRGYIGSAAQEPPDTGWNTHPMCRTAWHLIIPAPEDVAPHADALHDDAAGPVVRMVDCALRGGGALPVQAGDIGVGCLESSRLVPLSAAVLLSRVHTQTSLAWHAAREWVWSPAPPQRPQRNGGWGCPSPCLARAPWAWFNQQEKATQCSIVANAAAGCFIHGAVVLRWC